MIQRALLLSVIMLSAGFEMSLVFSSFTVIGGVWTQQSQVMSFVMVPKQFTATRFN